jgi:hypothetical protein
MNHYFMPMKSLAAALLISCLFFSCASDKQDDGKVDTDLVNVTATGDGSHSGKLPVITFPETEHDLGKMTQGEKVKWSFEFTNTGTSALIISTVTTSCGCTVADYPKDPIQPGKGGKIDVVFNSEGKSGKVEKAITVVSNCEPNAKTLKIMGEVIVPTEKYSNETK